MDFLSEKTVREHLTMEKTIQSIEEFYLDNEEGNIRSPARMHVEDGDNTNLLMPSYYKNYYATKLVGVAPGNSRLNKPTIHGIMALYDRSTMEPLLLCDAMPITSMRTGALGGLGMKYLAGKEAVHLGIVGTGTQGWSHLQSALAVRNIEKVFVFNRTKSKAEDFIQKAEAEYPHLHIEAVDLEKLVQQSDIIVTATTSKTPVLPEWNKDLWKGKLIVGVGSFRPDMQEIPDSILQNADEIHVDAEGAFRESGDMLKAQELGREKSSSYTLKELISKAYFPEHPENKLIVFKSVGDAIFDLVTVKALYENKT
ncbi:ornithine cyclodeaminase family protein [Alkalicoccus halolimnae]|uniref:Ornithine cyclodeaminase family protein n=1 Tax=Alkalicoccus halolimnae TaxID=1667239 RepID=A0A5C7F4I6_9BACI|nr:ornithine cyclodeaminase family protein [Alkalicoccus halolimnae]TXF85552.1 ornithine cyclodeaminase family protein [Alkalicoccus halolimnae]